MGLRLLEDVGIRAPKPRSRPVSIYEADQALKRASLLLPVVEAQNESLYEDEYLWLPHPGEISERVAYRQELMLRYIYKRAKSNGWFPVDRGCSQINVALKTRDATEKTEAIYLTAPHQTSAEEEDECISIVDLAGFLHCSVIIAINSKVTKMLLRHLPPGIHAISLNHSTNIQVIDTLENFVSLRHAQKAAFVRESNSLLVWSDDLSTIIPSGRELEEKMVNLVWNENFGAQSQKCTLSELEEGSLLHEASLRSVSLVSPTIVALTFMVLATFIGLDVHEIVLQIKADGNYAAMGIVLYFPLMIWLAAFFAQTIGMMITQLLGPVSHLTTNSKYYSGLPPAHSGTITLPHITVQCPVYLEDLDTVLTPAIRSVQAAIKTYEMQGGTANLFINDDGLQLLEGTSRERRIAFYKQCDTSWIARPPDGQDGYVRRGKFKKASNMNYALSIAYLLEHELSQLDRSESWSDSHEKLAMQDALEAIMKAHYPGGLGEGDIRVGDLILLIDADTRIPYDCFLDAAYEFHESPDLAILQHTSLAFQVVHNYWEDCMAYFTAFVSESMRFMTAGGDVCPFIGHNAFLRWSAVQEIGEDFEGRRQWWSESHVSEDFEMSLRLQDLGYCIRMAAYSAGMFKEGVSLTVYDEFNRWQKYAYGISELCFNPLRFWWKIGVFSPLFKSYLCSQKIAFSSKFLMIAYMGSYYAIAGIWVLAILNYFIVGWLEIAITKLYQSTFTILIAALVVYDVANPVINAIYCYRSGKAPFLYSLYQNFKWILLLCLFFGGLSMHVSQSLVWHLLGLPIHWESTAKSLQTSYYLKELPNIWRRYKLMYLLICTVGIVLIVLGTDAVSEQWRLSPTIVNALPMFWVLSCHTLAPLLLNPQSWLSEFHV